MTSKNYKVEKMVVNESVNRPQHTLSALFAAMQNDNKVALLKSANPSVKFFYQITAQNDIITVSRVYDENEKLTVVMLGNANSYDMFNDVWVAIHEMMNNDVILQKHDKSTVVDFEYTTVELATITAENINFRYQPAPDKLNDFSFKEVIAESIFGNIPYCIMSEDTEEEVEEEYETEIRCIAPISIYEYDK